MAIAREASIDVGIFGGSGLYELLDDARDVLPETPYGPPSAPVVVGAIDGVRVGFMPRHGRNHELPPHRINYRANLWAMKALGATDVILPCAVGSLQRAIEPGSFVLADQVVDRTSGRADTFFDGPVTTHVGFADPYDEEMRATAGAVADELGLRITRSGTLVVIQGPRFSTRAESRWFASMGWDVVGMTQYPEVILARELEMAALNISVVTDYDVGVDGGASVSHHAVMEAFATSLADLRRLLFAVVPRLPRSPGRPALHALGDARG